VWLRTQAHSALNRNLWFDVEQTRTRATHPRDDRATYEAARTLPPEIRAATAKTGLRTLFYEWICDRPNDL
jgi:hypothetical protein